MIPFFVLVVVSALMSAALYSLTQRPLSSWLAGTIIPCAAFQWLNAVINGPDAFWP